MLIGSFKGIYKPIEGGVKTSPLFFSKKISQIFHRVHIDGIINN